MFKIVLGVKETQKLVNIACRSSTNMCQMFMHDLGHDERNLDWLNHARGNLCIDDSLKKSAIQKNHILKF